MRKRCQTKDGALVVLNFQPNPRVAVLIVHRGGAYKKANRIEIMEASIT